jgi:hypothetical protein
MIGLITGLAFASDIDAERALIQRALWAWQAAEEERVRRKAEFEAWHDWLVGYGAKLKAERLKAEQLAAERAEREPLLCLDGGGQIAASPFFAPNATSDNEYFGVGCLPLDPRQSLPKDFPNPSDLRPYKAGFSSLAPYHPHPSSALSALSRAAASAILTDFPNPHERTKMFRTSPIDEYSRVITIDGCDYEIVSRAVYGHWNVISYAYHQDGARQVGMVVQRAGIEVTA